MIAVLLFDRYKTVKDGVSPIGQMMDYVHFADYSSKENGETSSGESLQYQSQLSKNLVSMQTELLELEAERSRMLKERNELIKGFQEYNERIAYLKSGVTEGFEGELGSEESLKQSREVAMQQFLLLEAKLREVDTSYLEYEQKVRELRQKKDKLQGYFREDKTLQMKEKMRDLREKMRDQRINN